MDQLKHAMTKIINLYGGPGTGKSTTAAGLFAKMKAAGYSCEYVPEYAKDIVWEESFNKLDNQLYIFAKQYHRIFRLLGKVDYIITDSPLMLSLIYAENSEAFKQLVYEIIDSVETVDVFLQRVHEYQPEGRIQTAEEAARVDSRILETLKILKPKFVSLPAVMETQDDIIRMLQS